MVKGVIFDMDGTMLDTERYSLIAWKKAGEQVGFDIDEDFVCTLRGRISTEVKKSFQERFGEDFEYENNRAIRNRYMEDLIEERGVPKKKGLMELLDFLKEHRIPAAVATSTRQLPAEYRLRKAGIYRYFAARVYGDMGYKSKPDPEIFHVAAKELGLAPEECVVIEDSAPGVKAAVAAGGYAIYIPDIQEIPENAREGITAKMDSLLDVIDWIKKENQIEE